MFLGVPRVWEKIQEGITAAGSQVTGLKKKIADWAKSIGTEGTYAEINGGPLPSGWSIAKKLVFDKVKANLGLDQC